MKSQLLFNNFTQAYTRKQTQTMMSYNTWYPHLAYDIIIWPARQVQSYLKTSWIWY